MKIFTWDIQYFCPLKCVYCYSNSGPSRGQAKSSDLWPVAEAVAREKPDAVMISGGEPTLVKEIDEVAAYLRDRDISLSLFTSGWGATAPRIRRWAAAFDRIHVSFDSIDSEINDNIRGKVGAHESAVNTLRLLGKERTNNPRFRFGVDCTVVKANLASIDKFCAFLATFECLNFINAAPAVPTGRASEQGFPFLLDETEVRWLLEQSKRIRDTLPPSITLTIHRNEGLKHDDEHHVQLNANGDVRAIKICEATIGNIVSEPLDVILKRGTEWRKRTDLARRLPTVADFEAWREVVTGIDGSVHDQRDSVASRRGSDGAEHD